MTRSELRAEEQTGENVTIRVRYFARLREERGRSEETLTTSARTVAELFDRLERRFHFSLRPEELSVAVNAVVSDWETPLHEQDLVVFLPPYAGG